MFKKSFRNRRVMYEKIAEARDWRAAVEPAIGVIQALAITKSSVVVQSLPSSKKII